MSEDELKVRILVEILDKEKKNIRNNYEKKDTEMVKMIKNVIDREVSKHEI